MGNHFRTTAFIGLGLLALFAACAASAEDKSPYPTMAPLDQYLMERTAEIALARTAAPPSLAQNAEVMVLTKHGYETAVSGKNGFVCIVERSWASPPDAPNFWDPKLRAPICFNAAAARSFLPRSIKRTALILAGGTKDQMVKGITAALDSKELPAIEPEAMCYMLSKQGHLGDDVGHWHPHLMFFYSSTDSAVWGADGPDSPIIPVNDTWEHLTTLLIPVREWSDGTPDSANDH